MFLELSVCVVCLFAYRVNMTRDRLLFIALRWLAGDQLKILWQTPNQGCAQRVFPSTVTPPLLSQSPFSPSRRSTGVFSPTNGHTFIWAHSKITHAHTHTHKPSTPYYSLLICRALIETPLSPSRTCSLSLIISQGAFGRSREGDGDRERGLQSDVTGQLWSHKSIWMNLFRKNNDARSNMWIHECGYDKQSSKLKVHESSL